MSNHSPTEYVAAADLQPGDRILFTSVVVTVVKVSPTPEGVEVECSDRSGTAKLYLHRGVMHEFERITGDG